MLPLIPAFCWLIFIAYWIVSARGTKTTTERQEVSTELMTRIPLIAGGLLIWSGGRHLGLATPIIPNGLTPARIVGSVICAMGLLVALWARYVLAGNWSAEVTFKEGHELIQRGPYGLVRHPIYSGVLLMLLGTAVHMNLKGALLGVALFFLGFWLKLRQEEALMARHFPDAYRVYRARVKALIPGVL